MKPALEAHGLQWHGWHAYRRGLATNLKQMDVDDLTIQAILRHRDVATTRTFYIKTVQSVVREAMQQYGEKSGMCNELAGRNSGTRMDTGADDRT
jgi:integrase